MVQELSVGGFSQWADLVVQELSLGGFSQWADLVLQELSVGEVCGSRTISWRI